MTAEIGAANVTFQCVLINSAGFQVLTQWNIKDFRGEGGLRDIISTLPDTVLEGTPTNSTNAIFKTFREILKFPNYIEDFDGATLTCGSPQTSITAGMFPLRVYRKLEKKKLVHQNSSALYYNGCIMSA